MSTTNIRAWAAQEAAKPLVNFEYDPGPLGVEEVEIRVEHSGLCHSDLSVIDNEWGSSRYPTVGGHEVVGTVVALWPERQPSLARARPPRRVEPAAAGAD